MNNDFKNCENDLKYLCIEMIDLLNDLKKNGLIDEKEYKNHVKSKIDFLKSLS